MNYSVSVFRLLDVIAGRKDPKGLKSGQVLVDNTIVTSDLRLCSAYVVQVGRQHSLWPSKMHITTNWYIHCCSKVW